MHLQLLATLLHIFPAQLLGQGWHRVVASLGRLEGGICAQVQSVPISLAGYAAGQVVTLCAVRQLRILALCITG
jgi:hypothetical protein